jgi:hypothetical protein
MIRRLMEDRKWRGGNSGKKRWEEGSCGQESKKEKKRVRKKIQMEGRQKLKPEGGREGWGRAGREAQGRGG